MKHMTNGLDALSLMEELAGVKFTNPDEHITVATAHMMLRIAIKRAETYALQKTASLESELAKYKTIYDELEANQEPLENRVILAEARVKELEAIVELLKQPKTPNI